MVKKFAERVYRFREECARVCACVCVGVRGVNKSSHEACVSVFVCPRDRKCACVGERERESLRYRV